MSIGKTNGNNPIGNNGYYSLDNLKNNTKLKNKDSLIQLFKKYDVNGDGKISQEEAMMLLTKYNKDGKIQLSKKEFAGIKGEFGDMGSSERNFINKEFLRTIFGTDDIEISDDFGIKTIKSGGTTLATVKASKDSYTFYDDKNVKTREITLLGNGVKEALFDERGHLTQEKSTVKGLGTTTTEFGKDGTRTVKYEGDNLIASMRGVEKEEYFTRDGLKYKVTTNPTENTVKTYVKKGDNTWGMKSKKDFIPKTDYSTPDNKMYPQYLNTIVDDNGETVGYAEYESGAYFDNDKVTRKINYDLEGNVTSYIDYEYEDGNDYVTREINRNPDGTVKSYADYEYDSAGYEISVTHRNAYGKVIEDKFDDEVNSVQVDTDASNSEISNGVPSKNTQNLPKIDPNPPEVTVREDLNIKHSTPYESIYGEDGTETYCNANGYIIGQYDANGNNNFYVFRNDDDSIISYLEYLRDENGNVTRQISRNADGSIESYSDHEYDSAGNETRFINRNADGSIESYFDSEYDSAGNRIRSFDRNADGELESYSTYEYDGNGKEVRRNDYDKNGVIQSSKITEYDENGKQKGVHFEYPDS